MAVLSHIISLLLLLLLETSETHPMQHPTTKKHAMLLSKRRFLSPRDLHGTYSRFLEVSENSTLCPNTITHTTNGVLYPSGYIHIPLHHLRQDGHTCTGPGILVIRFRRTMNSAQIQHEFNITADATGIDKMVRDILLALDGFYFGRQTTERNCHGPPLPSTAAFFFTSQAKPFAANVGVPFHRNPKIMFLVDNTRVCAFSGSFMPPQPMTKPNQPIPQVSVVPKPRATPVPTFSSKPPSNPVEMKSPNHSPKQTLGTEQSSSQQPKSRENKGLPNTLAPPGKSQGAPVPSMQYRGPIIPPQDNSDQTGKDDIKSSTPLSTAGTESVKGGKVASTTQHHHKKEHRKKDEHALFSSPSPSHRPQETSHGPMSFPDKHSYETRRPSSSPSTSPTKNQSRNEHPRSYQSSSPSPSHRPQKTSHGPMSFPDQRSYETRRPSSSPSTSPTKNQSRNEYPQSYPSSSPGAKSQVVLLPSASPRELLHPSSSMKPSRPHSHSIQPTTNYPSPSPKQLLNGYMNESNSHSHGGLHGSSPMNEATPSPEPSAWEVVIGDSSSTCFPLSATVMLSNGGIKRMDELSIGTSISVGNGKSSRIIDFSHFDRTIVSAFLQLQTDSGRNLTVTPSHFVYTDHGLVPAAKVILGDYLKLSNGRPTRVINISRMLLRGLFNPQTLSGDIAVDGFIVSTYTLAAAPFTAHALLAPIRFLFCLGIRAAIVSKLAEQHALSRIRSLLSSSIHLKMF